MFHFAFASRFHRFSGHPSEKVATDSSFIDSTLLFASFSDSTSWKIVSRPDASGSNMPFQFVAELGQSSDSTKQR